MRTMEALWATVVPGGHGPVAALPWTCMNLPLRQHLYLIEYLNHSVLIRLQHR